jgi:DNA-directed RNA polymerase specialized sigma24 family protein
MRITIKMYEKEMTILNSKYQKWFNMLIHFGCHPDRCDDIIQDMYLKVYTKLKSGANIFYQNNEINYYFIFKVLRSLFIDLMRKEKDIHFVGIGVLHKMESDPDNTELYLRLEETLKSMYWYDRKVFEIVTEGESIRKLSIKTTIRYDSLYRTFNKTKAKIKKLL